MMMIMRANNRSSQKSKLRCKAVVEHYILKRRLGLGSTAQRLVMKRWMSALPNHASSGQIRGLRAKRTGYDPISGSLEAENTVPTPIEFLIAQN